MSQDFRSGKSFTTANRTIAALEFHNERVRQQTTEAPVASDHNQILGDMVDVHHRNMSMVGASLLKAQSLEKRSSRAALEEVEEFGDDSEGEAESAYVLRGAQIAPWAPTAPDCAVPPIKAGGSVTAKKCAQAADPVAFHRQMRAGTMSRVSSQRMPSSLKGAYAFLPPPPELEEDDDKVAKTDISTIRAKSFLTRPDQQAGGAYDIMMAQIRGSNWDGDGSVAKSSKSMLAKGSESAILLAAPRSGLHGEVTFLSSSLGSMTSTPKSFTSGASKGPSALPLVSVDSSPSFSHSAAHDRAPGRHSGAGGPSQGFFSKLKLMMKH